MSTLPVVLDRSRPEPLGAQLSARVRDLVLDGTLARGDRVPSSRALAADLGVSRSVTEQAYEQLTAEGWLEARHGPGTFMASAAVALRPGTAHDVGRDDAAGAARRRHPLDPASPPAPSSDLRR